MNSDIMIVSIGSGDPELLNIKTIRILQESVTLVLRTGKHPLVSWLREQAILFSTLDNLYEECEDFDQLNRQIAEYLFNLAESSQVVYAVPDALSDRSVYMLLSLKPDRLSVSLIPGVSAYDRFLSVSVPFLSEVSVTVVPAAELTDGFSYDPNRTLLITELDNGILAGQVKLFLSELLEDEHQILLLMEDEAIPTQLWLLDRHSGIDHRTAVLIPGSGYLERKRFVISDLISIMERLRAPSGCPWDRMQTHESLRPYVVEEAWECVASIDQQDMEHLSEELGDLLFQVVFHASIGQSYDEFTFCDVVSSICSKMIRRHPHVFGSRELKNAESVKVAWELIKQEETGHKTIISSLDDVSSGLPSLKYAAKVFKKISGSSFWRTDISDVISDLSDLIAEMHMDPESADTERLGELLLLCAELCQTKNTDGELVLHQAVDHLKKRMQAAEKRIINDGKTLEHLTFDELGVYLNHVKGEI